MCKLSFYGNCDPGTEGEEYCIFHRPGKAGEEAEEFWKKFFERFKPEEEELEIDEEKIRRFIFKEDVDCSGYVFPMPPEGTGISMELFRYSIFEGRAIFRGATFPEVDFRGASFSGEAIFSETKFKGDANFSGATFERSVSYTRTEFYGSADFSKARFPILNEGGGEISEGLLSYASFRRVYFKNPKRVVFDSMRGKVKISFMNTDVSRVVFRNCSFDFLFDEYLFKKREVLEIKLRDIESKGPSEGSEEIKRLREILEYELSDLTLDNVLSVIRMLRENFDYYMRYEESGRLFVKEMDLKRDHLLEGVEKLTDKIVKRVEWFAYSLYKWTCLYGESISRPIFLALAIIITFAIPRAFSPSTIGAWESFTASLTGWDGDLFALAEGVKALLSPFIEGIRESLLDFMQLGSDLGWLNLSERLLSAMDFATLYISLHRKLERRIRH